MRWTRKRGYRGRAFTKPCDTMESMVSLSVSSAGRYLQVRLRYEQRNTRAGTGRQGDYLIPRTCFEDSFESLMSFSITCKSDLVNACESNSTTGGGGVDTYGLFKGGHSKVPRQVVQKPRVHRAVNFDAGGDLAALLRQRWEASKVSVVVPAQDEPATEGQFGYKPADACARCRRRAAYRPATLSASTQKVWAWAT